MLGSRWPGGESRRACSGVSPVSGESLPMRTPLTFVTSSIPCAEPWTDAAKHQNWVINRGENTLVKFNEKTADGTDLCLDAGQNPHDGSKVTLQKW